MNSYPPEFLGHLRPVMFVAGLDVPSEPLLSDTEISDDDRILGKGLQNDPFVSLVKRLREALQEKSAKRETVWLGEQERSQPGYRMIMVDKNVRFPPQKATGHDSHSPLSPLTKTSPLYPDGLVAPIWVRKHTELLPAVFVLFLRLFEYSSAPPSTPISPLHTQNDKDDEKRKDEERKNDIDLSAEIALRKRTCSERGIKLTVVLMASRKMLDDTTLDLRLTFIRRQSGLDSRAALFVLSPVNAAELQDFVQSLQTALYDSALEYYGNHSKRVRRKRNKQAGSTGSAPNYGSLATPIASGRPIQPLRTQGWITRYEYKMGCFAEFRGEEEIARKHFQTSWEILVDMFGSIGILPPRTKRWAEAKVLADTISVKIIKLYLYRGEHSRAVSQFNAHLNRFANLNRIWGIDEDTWEFWSWIARWYRILAELVELALAHGLKVPVYHPDVPISSVLQTIQQPTTHQQPGETQRPSGMNPCNILQHPGFYYYAAAICTQRRLEKFTMTNREADASVIPNNLANERKVDHQVIILELYTKAYDWFKKRNNVQGQNRFTFHLACRIAQTYAESGKYEMAIKFFERIARTYRRERWKTLLRPVLSSWYTCCRETGDTDTAVKLLVEMICDDSKQHTKAVDLNKDLDALLTSTHPIATPLQIDLTDYSTIFKPAIIFWKTEVALLEQAPFQLHLHLPPNLTTLSCSRIRIEFSDGVSQLTINHKPSDNPSLPEIQVIDLGPLSSEMPQGTINADLRYADCGKLVLFGKVASNLAKSMKFSNIVMSFSRGDWIIDITLDANAIDNSATEWLCQVRPPKILSLQNSASTITFQPRQHRIQATFSHLSPAYLDEEYPITISITNTDDCPLSVVIDVLLHPAENETTNHITLNNVRSNSLIKGVSYDILNPAQTSQKVLLLHSTGAAGDRSLDISVQCDLFDGTESTETTSSPVSPASLTTVSESLHSLTIPTASPFICDSSVSFRLFSEGRVLEISDLKRYDASYVESYAQLILQSTISVAGPWPIRVEKISLLTEENQNVKLINCSLDDQGDFPFESQPGDIYSISCCFNLLVKELLDTEISIKSLGSLDVSWSRSQPLWDGATSVTTQIPLPGLSIPEDEIQVFLEIPAQGTLHIPFTASLRIRNKHPWRTADIHLQLEPSDNFVISGLRSGNLPILLAGNEDCIPFNLIPMVSGTIRLPIFKLFDRRKEKLEVQSNTDPEQYHGEIPVLDGRIQEKDARGNEIRLMVIERGENESVRTVQNVDANSITLFVLPS